jgi:DnaJ like chaperone protein
VPEDTFASLSDRSGNPLGAATILLLGWIMLADDDAADGEMRVIQGVSRRLDPEVRKSILDLARDPSVDDLETACRILQSLTPENRRLLLQLAVGVSLADTKVTAAEGHIVRFMADFLQFPPAELDAVFREMTGRPFPEPADPSSLDWWRRREEAAATRTTRRAPQELNEPSSVHLQRVADLGLFGLDETASREDVTLAFGRMTKIYHPDRFSTLGPEAVQAANVSYARLQQAYKRLQG